ncbi:MAG: hypothetical protein WCG95_04375 [bacterium]
MLTLQIEKIAKKLSVFTADDISVILETPEKELKSVLTDLEKQNLLKFDGNSYFYIEPIRPKPVRVRERTRSRKVFDINYQNYESDFINRVIAYFCADIESSKAAVLLNDRQNNIICIYGDFRKKIYEQQQELLQEKFEQTPKMPSSREYLRTNVWLYCYSKQVFVTTHALQTKSEAKIHTKKEIAHIKLVNCLLRRRFEKSSNFSYVEHRIAEHIWRKDKKFSELVQELTKLVENALPF